MPIIKKLKLVESFFKIKAINKIWKEKKKDSLQKVAWYWKIVGSKQRNPIIKKQILELTIFDIEK